MRKVFYCPAEIKELAEIIVTRPREVLSAISALSAGRLLSHADSIFLSHGNKGNQGNLLAPAAQPFLLFLLFLRDYYYLKRKGFCPTVIGIAASLVEEIKEIKEILLPARCEAISVISAISVGHFYLMRKVFCPAEMKEMKEILLPSLGEAISVISAISVGHFYLMRKVFCPAVIGFAASLVEEMKEMKEILLPSLGEAFLLFLPFLRDY